MPFSSQLPWHQGEQQMHTLLSVPEGQNPTSSFLTPQAAYALIHFPLLAIGIVDGGGQTWTSLWNVQSQPLGGDLVGVSATVDTIHDPVVQALIANRFGEQVEGGLMLSALPIDLMQQRRVKLFGRAVAGALHGDQVQIVIKVEQSMGNCPKYLNQKSIEAVDAKPALLNSGAYLSAEAVDLIGRADCFFLTTENGSVDMDTNYRGGPAGFMRVISPGQADGKSGKLMYPEYSGNRLYQSLGNLLTTPSIGLCVPDFSSGTVLYVTGQAQVLVGSAASAMIPHTNLAVEISILDSRLVANGLSFHGISGDSSPYNPRVRPLASETPLTTTTSVSNTATLISKDIISPSITRYCFRTTNKLSYEPGQWIALDFSNELDAGYSHMRDDDPSSLNDDYIRTFTISSTPVTSEAKEATEDEFEITLKTHAAVTGFLRRANVRAGIDVSVLGVGGDFVIRQNEKGDTPFLAGGVGITPLLGQLGSLDLERLRLVWIIGLADVEFVVDVFDRYDGIGKVTSLFLTGKRGPRYEEQIKRVEEYGAAVKFGRPVKDSIVRPNVERWYLCAGLSLRKQLLGWLDGQDVVFENFDY